MLLPIAFALAPLFADHAVLQAGQPAPVWGTAEPGEKVSVAFAGQTVSAIAGKDGYWIVFLDPLAADPRGSDLTVVVRPSTASLPSPEASAQTGTHRVHDVVVGEVWVASGQSNMEFVVNDPKGRVFRVQDAPAEVARADYPLIRQFKVERRVALTPSAIARGAWQPCSPATVPAFSAVAYFLRANSSATFRFPSGSSTSRGGEPRSRPG